MGNSAGGALLPQSVRIDAVEGEAFGTPIKTVVIPILGDALAVMTGGVQAWQNPESTAIMLLRAILDITTVATSACTLDVGYTATSAATSSDTLLDGVDANAAAATFDSMNAALDSGANAKAQRCEYGKWVTIDEKTGDAEGMVAKLYITYYKVTT